MLSHQNSKTATATASVHTLSHTHMHTVPSKYPNAVRQHPPIVILPPNAKSSQRCLFVSLTTARKYYIISERGAGYNFARMHTHTCIPSLSLSLSLSCSVTHNHTSLSALSPTPLQSIRSLALCYVRLSGSLRRSDIIMGKTFLGTIVASSALNRPVLCLCYLV